MLVLDCATPCRFLGANENEPQQIVAEKTNIPITAAVEEKLENKTQDTPALCCSACNSEMSKARTKFRIDRWEGSNQEFNDDNKEKLEKELPATVYLCRKCGKIEFRADEGLDKN